MTISNLGLINSDAHSGDAGQIDIRCFKQLIFLAVVELFAGLLARAAERSSITTQRLLISENDVKSVNSRRAFKQRIREAETHAGSAGDINIQAEVIDILDNSVINSSTLNAMGATFTSQSSISHEF
ncbi:MAG: hypothetical protein R3E08_11425 [Thiotrichaceae bacterium]